MDCPTGREPARHRPMRNNPAHPIADIFILTGDIGGRGWGQKRKGRGEWPQGPVGGGEGQNRGERLEQGRMGRAAQRNRYRTWDNRKRPDDGKGGARETGPPRRPGKQRRRQGGAPRGPTRGKGGRHRGVERRKRRRVGRGYRGGRDSRGGAGGEQRHADGVAMGHTRKRGGRATGGCTGRR